MTARPLTLATATALIVVIGTGIALVGALLLLVAAGGIAFLPPSRMSGVVGFLGIVALVIAAVTYTAAFGLWRRRPWGWVSSSAIAVSSVIGAVIALQTAGSQPPVAAGLVLTLMTVALLIAPSTRSASGIGYRV